MDKNKEFLKNTIIIFIGKFSTQFVSLFLLPLYTYCLTAADYGTIDLIQTYIFLFVPILTLRLDSVAFRFLIDSRKDKKETNRINTNIMVCLIIQCIISAIIMAILSIFLSFQYFILAIINTIVLMISTILLQTSRGMGNNPIYSKASIISAISTCVLSVFLIICLKMGAESILISTIVANLLCSIYIFVKNELYLEFKLELLNKKLIKEMLAYSLPMIPNSFSWWLINASDRTLIALFISSVANGIYSVSCKFSNILNSIFTIVSMSWQETTSLHINDEDADEFFSKIINSILVISISVSILLTSVLPFAFDILIGKEFIEAYRYIPILLIANIFNIFVGLIGGIYVAKKMTKEIAKTTLLSAIISITINLLLIQKMGIYAAAISTLVSYVAIGIYRHIDIQKYINIRINKYTISFFCIGICLSTIFYYYNNFWTNCISLAVSVILVIIFNKTLLNDGYKMIKNKIRILKIRA